MHLNFILSEIFVDNIKLKNIHFAALGVYQVKTIDVDFFGKEKT